MAASAKEKKATRITTACNPCRSRKQKCSGERPACEQCLEYNRACAWPAQLKRGPAKGYIEALEHRLYETETVLLKILPHISQSQLASILSDMSSGSTSGEERGGGRPVYAPISPLRKRGVEYWKSYPLSSVQNIRKWEQDCHALRRARLNNVSQYDDSSLSSSVPSKRLKLSEETESSSSDLGGKRGEVDNTSPSFDGRSPTTEPPPPPPPHHHDSGFISHSQAHTHRLFRSPPQQQQQINVDALHVSPPAEEDLSSEELHSTSTTTTYGRHTQQQGRPLSEEERPLDATGSYYVVDHNTLSQLAFLKGGGGGSSSSGGGSGSSSFAPSAPPAPQELSSWDAAPPIKFQQQFLW
ncbi:hypothetical protein VTN96DRAFT_1063 [Rasamsonia emersonii]